VEWVDLLKGALGSSPIALVLGFACQRLWAKLEQKDAEIRELNSARVKDLIAIAARDDD
jgi:hypothetical protein